METLIAKYLSDEMSETERLDFEKQLVEDKSLRDALEQCLILWHKTTTTTTSKIRKPSYVGIPAIKDTTVVKQSVSYAFLKIAATLLIILAAGYLLSDRIGTSAGLNELVTGVEMKEFQLRDGSVIKLNANSKITYDNDFGVSHRNIKLTGGANFDVAKNQYLPFVISTVHSRIEVLGTSFDVHAYPGKTVELNVAKGQVKFSSATVKNKEKILKAGERAVLSERGTKMQSQKVENQNYAAWWTRKLIFEEAPFREVVKNLENTYWVKIDFSKALADCKLSAIYHNESLEAIIRKIVATYPQSAITMVKLKENHIKLEGKACAY